MPLLFSYELQRFIKICTTNRCPLLLHCVVKSYNLCCRMTCRFCTSRNTASYFATFLNYRSETQKIFAPLFFRALCSCDIQ